MRFTDDAGTEWERTEFRDKDSTYEDNYYYRPLACFCKTDYDGCGYNYEDEYGACDYCEHVLRQINGHNDDIEDPKA